MVFVCILDKITYLSFKLLVQDCVVIKISKIKLRINGNISPYIRFCFIEIPMFVACGVQFFFIGAPSLSHIGYRSRYLTR